jgi:uncharacterized repeat protein (TIGR03803 family)
MRRSNAWLVLTGIYVLLPACGGSGGGGGSAADGEPEVSVPNVVGQTQSAGTTTLTGAMLEHGTLTYQSSSTVPAGAIISEDPAAGTVLAQDSLVNLVISDGSATESALYTFGSTNSATDGVNPVTLIQGKDGNLYGLTSQGGANENTTISMATGTIVGAGTLFKVTLAGAESVLYSFGATATDGVQPYGNLLQATDGNFYGATQFGGQENGGVIFKITPAGAETVLYSFGVVAADGLSPIGGLVQGTDGNFYGTTGGGGEYGLGTAFKLTPAGVETVLHSFGGTKSDGGTPQSGLVLGADGNFYGTTSVGGFDEQAGASGFGTVFKLSAAGVESVLYAFGSSNSNADGVSPVTLIQGMDGNFYGTTLQGGSNQDGIVFQVTPAGTETVLYSFGTSSPARADAVSLIQGTNGNLFGTSERTVFEMTLAGAPTVLYTFDLTTTNGPPSSLLEATDGNFYGVTNTENNTVFELVP